MRGSFSITKVPPTIAPDLDYGELGGVTDGTAAQVAYLDAVFEPGMTGEGKEEYRRDLLRYCELDTWLGAYCEWGNHLLSEALDIAISHPLAEQDISRRSDSATFYLIDLPMVPTQ